MQSCRTIKSAAFLTKDERRSAMRRGPEDRDRRKADAELREEARAKLSPQQQLERLDTLLGKGEGAVKERARLEKACQ